MLDEPVAASGDLVLQMKGLLTSYKGLFLLFEHLKATHAQGFRRSSCITELCNYVFLIATNLTSSSRIRIH